MWSIQKWLRINLCRMHKMRHSYDVKLETFETGSIIVLVLFYSFFVARAIIT